MNNLGLDFLDIKKEIKDQLKKVDQKYKGTGGGKIPENTMVFNDQSVQDLRLE